jgi:hypothetical protein
MSEEFKTLSRASKAISKKAIHAGLAGTLLVGCVTYHEIPPYAGPVAPPQIAYRIDGHRYFEIVPKENNACFPARLNYVDTALGIRTDVTSWNLITAHNVFTLDAASNYLVTPLIDPNCETGGGNACMPFIRYSTDAGRTWQVGRPRYSSPGADDVYLIGDSVYYGGQRARVPDLISGYSAWSSYRMAERNELPPIGKAPIDTSMHCDRSKTTQVRE